MMQLLENSHPTPTKSSDALAKVVDNAQMGKNNPTIVKVLIKVVLDDIYYEIACSQDYLDYLEENLKRFKKIDKYYNKMLESKTEDKKNYYLEYMKIYFKENENFDNFEQIHENYKSAYEMRKQKVDNLYNEIKIIKKLKV